MAQPRKPGLRQLWKMQVRMFNTLEDGLYTADSTSSCELIYYTDRCTRLFMEVVLAAQLTRRGDIMVLISRSLYNTLTYTAVATADYRAYEQAVHDYETEHPR